MTEAPETGIILAVQFTAIIVIGFFLFRRLRRSISANGLPYTEPQLWAIAVSAAIVLADGCPNACDPDDPPIDVQVNAEVGQGQNETSFTVVNGSSVVVVYQRGPVRLNVVKMVNGKRLGQATWMPRSWRSL